MTGTQNQEKRWDDPSNLMLQHSLQTGYVAVMALPPYQMIKTIRGFASEFRWLLEYADPKRPVQEMGLTQVYRFGGNLIFRSRPDRVRVGYMLLDGDRRVIVGDRSLWAEDQIAGWETEELRRVSI